MRLQKNYHTAETFINTAERDTEKIKKIKLRHLMPNVKKDEVKAYKPIIKMI